jgi:hypothetical protein
MSDFAFSSDDGSASADLRRRLAALDVERLEVPDDSARDLQRQLRSRVLEEAGTRIPRALPDAEREERIRRLVDEIIEQDDIRVSPTQRLTIIRLVVSVTVGY